MKATFFGTLAIGIILSLNAYGASLKPADFPSLISTINHMGPLELCGEKIPVQIQNVRERLEKELLLTAWDRAQVVLWLKRSRRFMPPIERMLNERHLPDDLKYVAVAESALRAHAGSRKGAIGFWQFVASTGRKYGLKINRQVDERRNLFYSTRAALRYFEDLYREFGSWTLAVAAYNMGEEGLRAEILAQETDDYYRLYLPLETQRFIFRILSVKLIFKNPEHYGFVFTDKDFYPPLTFDRVQVDNRQEIAIQVLARAAGTDFKAIKDLNPHLRGHYLGTGSYEILVPKGASAGFESRYRQLVKTYRASREERIYIVRQGDNLSAIAEKFNVPLAALLIWNRINLKQPIHPGQRLVIHSGDRQSRTQAGGENRRP